MRTIIWFFNFWIYLLVILPKYRKVCKLREAGDIQAHDEMTRLYVGKWARNMIKMAGGTVEVKGLEHMPATGAVYVGNHIGNFDIPLAMAYLGDDTKPMFAKIELKKMPMIRDWMEELYCVFVDRKNPRAAVSALNQAAKTVNNGYSMVIFPEGTRSPDGLVKEFKGGAFKIAQKTGAPVVPFAITGTDKMMPRGSMWIRPATLTLEVLPPIHTTDFTREDFANLPEECANRIRKALHQI